MWRCIAGLVVVWTSIGTAQAQPSGGFDWSGFYVGGSLGAVDGVAGPDMSVVNTGAYFTPPDPEQIAGANDGSLSQWRPTGGLHGGYTAQFGNVVIGAEIGAQSLFFDDSQSQTVVYVSSPTNTFTATQTVRADWMATLRSRLGWAQDRWLAYATGGVAFTRLQLDSTFTDTAFNAVSSSSIEETAFGYAVGGGGEYALDESWSVRAEYLFTDFGEIDATEVVTQTAGVANDSLRHATDLQTHSFMIGVSYQF